MDERVLAERRRTLSTPPKESQKKKKPSGSGRTQPAFAKMKLRKTGMREEEAAPWYSFRWLSLDTLCGGMCLPGDEGILETPRRQRIDGSRTLCCACQQAILTPFERYNFRGAAYHKKCVVCAVCGTSLASDSHVKLVKDGEVLCAGCHAKVQGEERRSRSDHVVGATQEEAGTRKAPEAKGDVTGVLEVIGDELEEAFRRAVPVCEICGAPFAKADQVHFVVVGDKRLPKYHAECLRLGKPRDGVVHSAAPPRVAARSAPEKLVLRVSVRGTAVTLFFDKVLAPPDDRKHHSKAENEAPAVAKYRAVPPASESERTPAVRKKRESLIASALASNSDDASFQIVGDPAFVKGNEPGGRTKSQGHHVLLLEALKNRLLYVLKLPFALSPDQSLAQPRDATLTISLPPR